MRHFLLLALAIIAGATMWMGAAAPVHADFSCGGWDCDDSWNKCGTGGGSSGTTCSNQCCSDGGSGGGGCSKPCGNCIPCNCGALGSSDAYLPLASAGTNASPAQSCDAYSFIAGVYADEGGHLTIPDYPLAGGVTLEQAAEESLRTLLTSPLVLVSVMLAALLWTGLRFWLDTKRIRVKF